MKIFRPARDFLYCYLSEVEIIQLYNNHNLLKKMTEIKNTVQGTVKKPYEKPEIEVFDLDNQSPLLAASGSIGVGFRGIDDDDL